MNAHNALNPGSFFLACFKSHQSGIETTQQVSKHKGEHSPLNRTNLELKLLTTQS
jgi:hypothetical protein